MAITDYNDQELLTFLLLNDFSAVSSREELEYIYNKFKHFFKIQLDKNSNLLSKIKEYEYLLDKLKNGNKILLEEHLKEKKELEDELFFHKNRKLTWKERFNGSLNKKIKPNKK